MRFVAPQNGKHGNNANNQDHDNNEKSDDEEDKKMVTQKMIASVKNTE